MKLNTASLLAVGLAAGFGITATSVSAATVFSQSAYNSYDNPAQGAGTISPFASIFGSISEQDVEVESGFAVTVSHYDFRGLSATAPGAGQTYFFLEDLQDGQFDAPGATLTANEIRTDDGRNGSVDKNLLADSIDEDDGVVDGVVGTPRGGIRVGTRVVFDANILNDLPNHVGHALAGNSPTFSITAFNINGDEIGTATASPAEGGITAFVGLITDEGIASVTFDGAETDHFQYGFKAVPEPSSLALLGLGGLMLARRRRG